jgi:prepilin signal peptidase PulO-like enzyme (type II secretory pathway)
MWLAVLLGLCVGLALSTISDRFSQRGRGSAVQRRSKLQWGVLTLTTTALCVYLQGAYGWSLSFARLLTCCSVLLLIAMIDLRTRRIPNVLSAFGAVLALGFSIVLPAPGLVAALEGTALGGAIFLLLALLRRNAMGFGDVKLAVVIGMMTGFPMVLQALVLGIVLGGLAAGVLLLTRLRKPKQYIPYAPYLAAGAMLTLLYGPRIAALYASLKGGR